MYVNKSIVIVSLTSTVLFFFTISVNAVSLKAGAPELQKWLLPDEVPQPANNKLTPEKIELGRMLFFDPRLSGDGNMSCASCHSPLFGWSDGLTTARGNKSKVLDRASPVVTNTAYNKVQMWDGRKRTLEDQAMGPMEATVEMNMDIGKLFKWLKSNKGYQKEFEKAYPGEGINQGTVSKAIASYERTIISKNSPFDQWVKGDSDAMTKQQVRGFGLFLDQDKGNCVACHGAPNFIDNGFHNIGLQSYGKEKPDMGRFTQLPLPRMKGAFKTPTLRDIELSAPYFHDGSALTLMEAVVTYADHGYVEGNISPEIDKIKLNKQDMKDIVAFMKALTTPPKPVTLPILPLE